MVGHVEHAQEMMCVLLMKQCLQAKLEVCVVRALTYMFVRSLRRLVVFIHNIHWWWKGWPKG